jgi:hypothetical protein
VIDVTEQAIERPQKKQKVYYKNHQKLPKIQLRQEHYSVLDLKNYFCSSHNDREKL